MDSHGQHVKLLVSREQRMIHSSLVLMSRSSRYMPFWTFSLIFDYTCPYSLYHIFLLPFMDDYSQSFWYTYTMLSTRQASISENSRSCTKDRTVKNLSVLLRLRSTRVSRHINSYSPYPSPIFHLLSFFLQAYPLSIPGSYILPPNIRL